MEDFSLLDFDDAIEFSEEKLARFQRSALVDKKAEAEAKRIYAWKRRRANIRQKKKNSEVKEETQESILSTDSTIVKSNKYRWRNLKFEDIDFFLPNITIDLSFTRDLPEREQRSVATQISMSYSSVRKSSRPVFLHLCSFEGPITELARRQDGFDNWKILIHEEPFWDTFDTDRVIYMTPDSDCDLETIEQDKIYIVGGIADNNNSMKNATNSLATAKGIKTARLPIDKYLDKKHKKSILNVNHEVVDILISVAEDGDWHKAINQFVPMRYQVQ